MAREKFPSDDVDRQMLRFPAGLKDRIAVAAKSNGRSINAEIVQLLEMYYPPVPPADEIAELIDGLLRITKGNPPKERWSDMYSWLVEFQARLMRESIREKYGEEAAAEFEAGRNQ